MGTPNGDMRAALEQNRRQKSELEIVESVPESHNQRSKSRRGKEDGGMLSLRWMRSDN